MCREQGRGEARRVHSQVRQPQARGSTSEPALPFQAGSALPLPRTATKTPTLRYLDGSQALPHVSPELPATRASPRGSPSCPGGRGAGKVLAPRDQGAESQPAPSCALAGKAVASAAHPQLCGESSWARGRGTRRGAGAASKGSSAPLRVCPLRIAGGRWDLGAPIPASPQAWEE